MTAEKVGGVLALATAAIVLGAVPVTAAAEVPAAGRLSNSPA
jgi:hypothetical protein